MSKFCKECGMALSDGERFCSSCGTAAEQLSADVAGQILATPTAGEVVFAGAAYKAVEAYVPIPNPIKVLFSGVWNVIRGVVTAFKDKKRWIPALVLAVVWFLLTLLPLLRYSFRPLRVLSWLTFAQGGMKGDIPSLIGGFLGKGLFAGVVFSMISGGGWFKNVGSGIKTMFTSFAFKGLKDAGVMLLGIGIALIFYNFMAGYAVLSMSMAAISGFLLSLGALGGSSGFLKRFFGGLFVKKKEGKKATNTVSVNRLIAGLSFGFLVGVAVSALNILNLSYIIGIIAFIAGIVLSIIGKGAFAFSLIIIFCLPIAATAELLDRYEEPAQIYRSGTFEATDKTKLDFSLEGGTLTGASWTVVRHGTIYSLEGTFKEGEDISINIIGTQAPIDSKYLVFNYMKLSLVFFDSGYNKIGDEQVYFSEYVQEPTLKCSMGSPVPEGTHQVSISGSFNCRWANMVVVDEGVALYVTLKPEKEAPAALPTENTGDSESEEEPPGKEEKEQAEPEPVVQVDDEAPAETASEETSVVKTAAIIGIAATMAALGAAGATGSAGSGAGGENSAAEQKALEEAAKQKTGDYRMVVYKNFGDTIEFDKPRQEVHARIEYFDTATGTWQYDASKSMAISVALTPAKGLSSVPAASLPGKGKGVSLSYKNDKPDQNATTTLSFRYTAPDSGYFDRQMQFKLAGKPTIQIEKKINLLSTEAQYDVPYKLTCCGELPELQFICSSGLVTADLSVGDEENKRFLRLSPAEEAVEWDRTTFTRPVKCTLEVRFGNKPEDKVSEDFEVILCYEGIGTAYEGVQANKIPRDEDIIQCDPDTDTRYEKGVWLSLVTIKWDENARTLKNDTALSGALEFEFELDTVSVKYDTPEKLSSAQASMEEAFPRRERTERARPAELKSVVDSKKNPLTYVVFAGNDSAGSVDPLPITMTVTSNDSELKPLTLNLKIQFSNNLREYIKRFFSYSENTFARSFASFGSVSRYLAAMDFIEDRVYTLSNAPFALRMNDNYYENAEGHEGYTDRIMNPLGGGRVRSVVLKDECYPQHGNDMENIKSLVHELTHALEHINGSVSDEGGERHSYFLQYASDAFNKLADIERGFYTNLRDDLGDVVNKIRRTYINVHNTQDPRQLTWFGADMPPTQHYFIDKYIKEFASFSQSSLTLEKRQEIADVLTSTYFPVDIKGFYKVSNGPFKDSVWTFIWVDGLLQKTIVLDTNDYYVRLLSTPRWVGGNKAVLKFEVEVSKKGVIDFESIKGPTQEIFDVELVSASSDYYDMNRPEYERRDDLVLRWYTRREVGDSMLFGHTKGSYFVSPLIKTTRPTSGYETNDPLGNR